MYSVAKYPFIPLTHPKCPVPGDDFVTQANHIYHNDSEVKYTGSKVKTLRIGQVLTELYTRATYEYSFVLNVAVRAATVSASCMPGHIWLRKTDGGPRRADVMLINKLPTVYDINEMSHLSGELGKELQQIFEKVGISPDVYKNWYVTAAIKHAHIDPTTKTIPVGWLRNWAPVLFQELCIVRPRIIVSFGAEPAKVLTNQKLSVKDSLHTVYDVVVPAYKDEPEYTAKMLVMINPGVLKAAPEQRIFLEQGAAFLKKVVDDESDYIEEKETDHAVVYYADELEKIVDDVMARSGPSPIIVFDSEWDGQHYVDPKSYVRTIQFSDKAGFACCVVLTEAGGESAFVPNKEAAIKALKRLVTPTANYKPRIAGHHLRADLPWITHRVDAELGALLLDGYKPAETPEGMRQEGGLDTMVIAHAIREVGFQEAFKLEYVCQALLGSPLWNVKLEKWKKNYCKAQGIRLKDLDGYGQCPDEILHPYACFDVSWPRELIDRALSPGGLLDKDEFGNSSWVPFHTTMKSAHAFLEMEMAGIFVDLERVDILTQLYQAGAAKLLSEIRQEINWPDFNPASSFDSKELLYGEELARRKSASKRPPDARVLNLPPIKTSSKPPKDWDKLSSEEKLIYSPSTDKETLGILASMYKEPVVDHLRKYRFLSQVLKTTLRPPTEVVNDNDESELQYEEGLLSYVQTVNNRIYTNLFPTQETGRSSSVRPNLTNVSKRREKDYASCLGDAYKYPLRSIFTATPGKLASSGIPTVLVEFDLRGAELKVMAIQSGDANMISHTERNNLPEDHPDYMDIHSNTAVKAFKLDCPPTKAGLASIKKKNLRDVAKTFAFGLPYGRGDDAIVRGCKEEGVETNLTEVEALRNYFFGTYPMVQPYISACQERAITPRWLRNCFGRLRRFAFAKDREIKAKLKREAGNFPIQSTVADLVHNWMSKLYGYPERTDRYGNKFTMLLQIHDAILVECRVDCLDWFVDEVIPKTLDEIVIYQCNLDGSRLSNVPYRMGTDITIYKYWGMDITEQEAKELGVNPRHVKGK